MGHVDSIVVIVDEAFRSRQSSSCVRHRAAALTFGSYMLQCTAAKGSGTSKWGFEKQHYQKGREVVYHSHMLRSAPFIKRLSLSLGNIGWVKEVRSNMTS